MILSFPNSSQVLLASQFYTLSLLIFKINKQHIQNSTKPQNRNVNIQAKPKKCSSKAK